MARAALGMVFLLVVALLTPSPVPGQTKDDTLVYALQSDVQNWDPPNSVLRESIILGYNVFDHLAARDLKTGKVGPSLAVSWKALDADVAHTDERGRGVRLDSQHDRGVGLAGGRDWR